MKNETEESGGAEDWAEGLEKELAEKGKAAIRKNYMISLAPELHKAGRFLALKRDISFSALVSELLAAAVRNG